MAARVNALAVKRGVLLVRNRAVVPTSFVAALKRGWTVAKENTVLGADKRHRYGTLFLTKPSGSKLVVDYTGTIKQGYRFGKPRLA